TQDTGNAYNRRFSWFDGPLPGRPGGTFHFAAPDEPGGAGTRNCNRWNLAGRIIDQGTWAHQPDATYPNLDPQFRVLVTAPFTDYNDCAGGTSVNILAPSIDFVDVKQGSVATNRLDQNGQDGTNLSVGNHQGEYTSFLSNTNNR